MIIAIAGDSNQSIGSGKDTVGRIIQYLFTKKRCKPTGKPFHLSISEFLEKYDSSENFSFWEIKKFAEVTTKSFELITGINFHKLSREEKEKIRVEYVKFAEGCKEIFGEEVWINSLMRDYSDGKVETTDTHYILKHEDSWIITDLRFPNEYKAVKDRKGLCVKVTRTYENACKNIPDVYAHSSETALNNHEFDYIIENNGTIDDLVVKVEEFLIKFNLLD